MMKSASKTTPASVEINRLRDQVRELVGAARHNEQVHNRFQAIELSLLAAQDFYAFSDYLMDAFKSTSGLDQVSLVLLDTRSEISEALNVYGQDDVPEGLVLI